MQRERDRKKWEGEKKGGEKRREGGRVRRGPKTAHFR